jgi:hypothetical protein
MGQQPTSTSHCSVQPGATLSYIMLAWSWSSCTCGGFSYSSWLQQQLFLGWQQLLLILCARKHKQRMVALFTCQRHSVLHASPTSSIRGARAPAHVGLPNPHGCSSDSSLRLFFGWQRLLHILCALKHEQRIAAQSPLQLQCTSPCPPATESARAMPRTEM